MQFGTVAEVISSQVHHMNCCEESEIFSTANMLHKIQFLRPLSNGECTSATEERDSDNKALGESTAATKASAIKEANIHCREYVTNETDVDCSSPTTNRERNCNSTVSSDMESDMYHEAPSKDTSDDYEKETKDGHRAE